MQQLRAIADVLDIFGSFDFFRMSVRGDLTRIGVPTSEAALVLESGIWSEVKNVTLFFVTDDACDFRIVRTTGIKAVEIVQQNAWLGTLIALEDGGKFALYFETLERQGFVCGTKERLNQVLKFLPEREDDMRIAFRGAMQSIANLGGKAPLYVAQMERLIGEPLTNPELA